MRKIIVLFFLVVTISGQSQSAKTDKYYRNNWFDFINVKTNKFSYSKTEGIKGLKITAFNKTKYKIDSIEIIICYETNDDYCYKTENIEIKNIQANSTKTIAAPNSKGGKKISTQIMGMSSKQMNFGYAPGNWGKDSDDPYYIKQ